MQLPLHTRNLPDHVRLVFLFLLLACFSPTERDNGRAVGETMHVVGANSTVLSAVRFPRYEVIAFVVASKLHGCTSSNRGSLCTDSRQPRGRESTRSKNPCD